MSNLKTVPEIKKAVILAGGLGTRFLPATLVVAKELFPICEQPILMYHLEDLIRAGFTDILIVGNKLKEESFMSFINPSKEYLEKVKKDNKLVYLEKYNNLKSKVTNISYINQEIGSSFFNDYNNIKDIEQRGSSIAILSCKDWANGEPFMVFNGDDFCSYDDGKSVAKDLVDVYKATGDYVVFGREVDKNLIHNYSSMILGDKLFDEKSFKMKDIIEKPKPGTAPSNIMGFAKYIFTNDVFEKILKSNPRQNGEFCITDVISDTAKEGRVSTSIFNGRYFDCGNRIGLQMAGNYLLLNDKNTRELIIKEFETLKNSF